MVFRIEKLHVQVCFAHYMYKNELIRQLENTRLIWRIVGRRSSHAARTKCTSVLYAELISASDGIE
jgi:hypothetical protein